MKPGNTKNTIITLAETTITDTLFRDIDGAAITSGCCGDAGSRFPWKLQNASVEGPSARPPASGSVQWAHSRVDKTTRGAEPPCIISAERSYGVMPRRLPGRRRGIA